MRNLEDCKTEVFRRSEERIKERKRKRNRVLACCIPLCLLLVAGGLYIRPLLEPVDESMKSGGTKQIPDRVLGGLESVLYGDATEYTCVKITDGTGETEMSRYSTDKEIVGGLGRFVATVFTLSETKETYPADGSENDGIVVPEMSTTGQDWDTIREELEKKYGLEEKKAEYTFTFQGPAEEELIFRLCGNVLFDVRHNNAVTLSDVQLALLKTQLVQALGKEE
ncbi:MAG: hypothetical protein E7268_07410 [Lachnospiraceae bacterium]|nr:hypothetical protein [Lachnospiraceae bacterium]